MSTQTKGAMATENLDKNLKYVKANLDSLINLHKNKYVLVYDEKIVGSFDTYESAANEGVKSYGIGGDFLVYYVTEETPVNFVSVALI